MQSKVKLTKRQVKEDRFTTFMLSSKDQFQENWQFYVVGIVVVVLVVSAVAYYFNSRSAKEAEGTERFARAMLDYQNGDKQVALLGFSQILEEYGSTAVAEQATYLLGNINLSDHNYEEAVRYFEMFLSEDKSKPFKRAAALAGLASAYENQGNYADAAGAFIRASEEFPGGPLHPDYELGAVRNFLEIGDVESAEIHLDVLKEKYEGSEYCNRAIRLFAEKGQS